MMACGRMLCIEDVMEKAAAVVVVKT